MKKTKVKEEISEPTYSFAWCYGLVNMGTKKDPWYALREITHKDNKVIGHTEATLGAESPEEVARLLRRMLRDIKAMKPIKDPKK